MKNRKSFSASAEAKLLRCIIDKAVIFMYIIVCTAMLFAAKITVCAHEVPDITRKGSICITMQLEGKAVPGGTLTLYKAGVIDENDGNYSFVPSEPFRDYGASFGDEYSDRLAVSLTEYVREHRLSGTERNIGSDGIVLFTALDPGLYLLIQDVAAEGFQTAAPFLVSVPMTENGSYIYDVEADPKVELTKAPAEPEEPVTPVGPKLPQTGQLNWPIPLLVVLGLCLLSVGWLLCFGKRKPAGRRPNLEN